MQEISVETESEYAKKTAEKRERGGNMESAAVNPKIQQGAGETRKLAASFVGTACSLI